MRISILGSLSGIVQKKPSVGEMIKLSYIIQHASSLLYPSSSSSSLSSSSSSSSSSSLSTNTDTQDNLNATSTTITTSSSPSSTTTTHTTTTSIPSSVVLSVEEKEGLLELICVLVRRKISLDDEEGILSSAMKLEEEANLKEDAEEEISEEEREKWRNLSDGANKVIREMLKKKGKRVGIGRLLEEKEEEKKKREEAEEREKRAKEEVVRERAERKEAEKEKKKIEEEMERMRMRMRMRMSGDGDGDRDKRLTGSEKGDSAGLSEIRSLSRVRVYMPQTDNVKCEGNQIIHHGDDSFRNVVIGDVMTSV